MATKSTTHNLKNMNTQKDMSVLFYIKFFKNMYLAYLNKIKL